MENNSILDLIEMLYTMVSEAWGVPLGNEKCIIERDKFLNILDEIKAQLPVEVAEAKRLLEFTGMSICDIAEATGFYDQSYFSKLFTREVGRTPSDFRKEARK